MTAITMNSRGLGINEAFPYKICINLDRRPDRWARIRSTFEKHEITSVRRFSALDGETLNVPPHWTHTRGAYGCLLSHLGVVEQAGRLGLSEVLIFEDDAAFDPELQEKFVAYFRQLPSDWHMLYFGALHKDEPIRIADNVSRITMANSTYAYAIRNSVFDAFVELNRKAETVLDNTSFTLQEQFNCYCFTPHLAWVETDYSDAQNRLEHHWYLEESLVLFGSQVDRLLSETTLILAHGGNARAGLGAENLGYLVRYHNEFFSSRMDIMIVEQGVAPTVDQASLPANCKYLFVPDNGLFDRELCFRTGIDNSNPENRFLILSDSDIYLETLDIRANLRMCERYDWATGFREIVNLTGNESVHLREANTTRGIDITQGALRTKSDLQGTCCFVRREAVHNLRRLSDPTCERFDPAMLLKSIGQFRVFESPNRALRLAC